MTKRITISDKDYYLILGLKAKHLTDSIEEIIRLEGMKPDNLTKTHTTTKADNHETMKVIALKTDCQNCGHALNAHYDDGCMAEGGLCECKKFTEGAPP